MEKNTCSLSYHVKMGTYARHYRLNIPPTGVIHAKAGAFLHKDITKRKFKAVEVLSSGTCVGSVNSNLQPANIVKVDDVGIMCAKPYHRKIGD